MEPKSRPFPLDRTPGTFSQTTHSGRSLSTSPRKTRARFPRGSARPFRNPSRLKDWQGVPAQIRSTRSSASPFSLVMSPRLGVPANRCARTALAKGSISPHQAACQPSDCHAHSGAPIPLQRVANFIRTQQFPVALVRYRSHSVLRQRCEI